MSEIEKLYENAGVQSFKTCEFCTQKNIDCLKENTSNITCGLSKDAYPPFTSEKQLELIKWLAVKDCMFRVTYEREFLWCSQLEWQSSFCYESFEESLANLINTLWQSLTEKEKQQIKEILE